MSDDRPIRWASDEPTPGADYGPPPASKGPDPDWRRIEARRQRHAAEDRAATIRGGRVSARDRPWSALAVVAFVLSLFIAPVGLVLGVIGLFLVDGEEYRGRALAGWAVAIGVVFTVIGFVVFHNANADPAGTYPY